MIEPQHPIDLPTNLGALEAVLKVCCGIPGSVPRDAAVPFVFPEVGADGNVLPNGDTGQNTIATPTYDIISIVGLGRDELRTYYDPDIDLTTSADGDTFEPDPDDPLARLGATVATVSGNRQVTVQFKCEVQAAARVDAFVYLERVRSRLGLPSVVDALDAAGFALAHVGAAHPADYRDDSGLTIKVGVFEIVLNAADCAVDDPTTTIET